MKCLKIVLSPPLPTVIAFHSVKNSPLITGIVDRIKINSELLLPFSESELSHTFCKLHVKFMSVLFILAAIAHVWINLHRQHIMSVLCYKRLFTKACMGCKRFFLKARKNVMFLNKSDVPYCLVVSFVVFSRLRPF